MRAIHGGFSQLVRVHLTQALVALDRFFPCSPRLTQLSKLLVEFIFGIRVNQFARLASLSAHFNAVQRWNSSVNSASFDHGAHIAEEQGEQQRANMRAIDVSIGHQNNLAVAGGIKIESST